MNLQIWQRRWLHLSVRHKLMVLALLPLVVVLPLLMTALVLWGNAAYDQLLITKVRSDLAVARGYFCKCSPRWAPAPRPPPTPTPCIRRW